MSNRWRVLVASELVRVRWGTDVASSAVDPWSYTARTMASAGLSVTSLESHSSMWPASIFWRLLQVVMWGASVYGRSRHSASSMVYTEHGERLPMTRLTTICPCPRWPTVICHVSSRAMKSRRASEHPSKFKDWLKIFKQISGAANLVKFVHINDGYHETFLCSLLYNKLFKNNLIQCQIKSTDSASDDELYTSGPCLWLEWLYEVLKLAYQNQNLWRRGDNNQLNLGQV